MMDKKCAGDCTDTGCCAPKKPKPVVIDFLYLDLLSCDRCQGTLASLEEAIGDLSSVLNTTGICVDVRKTLIDTKEKAMEHRFIASPTIRVNGYDIARQVNETNCECCGDICGDNVDCRTWEYKGRQYDVPPKAFIIRAILTAIYSDKKPEPKPEYTLPSNLEKFFDAVGK